MDTVLRAPMSIETQMDTADSPASPDGLKRGASEVVWGVTPGASKKLKVPRRVKPDSLPLLSEGSTAPPEVMRDLPDVVKEGITKNWVSIRNYSHKGKILSVYNVRLGTDATIDKSKFYPIFEHQDRSFKVDASVGTFLRKKDTGEIRYWHSSNNNARLNDKPTLIQDREDFDQFVDEIADRNLGESLKFNMENSDWVLQRATNVSVYVYHLNHPIQGGPRGRPRNGTLNIEGPKNLCFFTALAAHKRPEVVKARKTPPHPKIKLTKLSKCLYQQYTRIPLCDFRGVTMNELDQLEKCFNIGIQVYTGGSIKEKKFAQLIRQANPEYDDRLNLEYTETEGQFHFSYIHDLKTFCSFYKCSKCGQLWPDSFRCERHMKTCDTTTAEKFPEGHFKIRPTVFESMAEVGVEVPESMKYYPHFLTFDFESIMKECEENFANEHVPISFSLCSNIEGLTDPVFRCDPKPDRLVESFLSLINDYSDASYDLLKPKYQPYLDQLQEKSEQISKREPKADDGKTNKFKKNNNYQDLIRDLESWLRKLPILGFNSQKYDLNAIKIPLVKALMRESTERVENFENDDDMDGNDETFDGETDLKVISSFHGDVRITKKNNSLMCIETPKLKILDISNYLSPCSYSSYLEAFHVEEKKGFFPYEYIKEFEQLYETKLPKYEEFYSTLNGKNLLDCDEDEISGRKRWDELHNTWKDLGMVNILSLLRWYNNLDVTAFAVAVKKQLELYQTHFKIDIFKEGISLPGISLKYAMKTTDAKFALYGEKFKWLYKELRESITGGPSIIFTRYHEKGITKIRLSKYGTEAELCEAVLGVDANSLYLSSYAQDFPAGDFEVRMAPTFEKVKQPRRNYSLGAIEWIEHEAKKRGVKIIHKLNSAGEVQIGSRKLKVDGFCPEQNSILEFHGCFYHSCSECFKDKQDETHIYYGISHKENRERTREKIQYLENLGYTVYEMWECVWNKTKPSPAPSPKSSKTLTEAQILKGVRDDKIFGLAKVDIHTPDRLKSKLAEFPPIFKNCEVGREHISPLMREYCETTGSLKKPSRLLISSYRAEQILLITPLLKYYLNLGLEVTKVHYIVEFPDHKPCFEKFADAVTNARRQGDKDPDSDILANTFKLTGNSAYGRVCMNKQKQTETRYATGVDTTVLINTGRFKQCRRLENDLYEVESYKKKHTFDLPLHLGVFTYQYAKLRMLEFHYDFMQKYIPSKMYELCEMDTDSSYFAISRKTLEECVYPHMKHDFYSNYDKWFPSPACPSHKNDFVEAKMSDTLWIPAECCKQFLAYDKRTPGKFKFEFEGDGIIALCSKTYICWGGKETKISCKGLQKKRNLENLTKMNYLKVLETQQSGSGVNKGFRAHAGRVFTYEQKRFGLSYMYCKRLVNDDGISTEPLDL